MSKELLKALVDVLDDLKLRKNLSEDDALNISDSVLVRAEKAIENYLTQPEQEVKVGIYDDIFSDYEYLVTAFKNGANADDYSSDIGRAFSDIRKARNWLCPLPKHVIDQIALKSFHARTFDFRAFARELEKQHGIGFADE